MANEPDDALAPTLAVVVPALNEARRIRTLLECLETQTRRPDAIIVADANSSDGTQEIARHHGAIVVAGGMPAVGRNAGARATTCDLIMFLDADAELDPDFIAKALDEFNNRTLSVTTAPMAPIEDEPGYRLGCTISKAYMRLLERISPHALGLCILVKRELHETIGGFDETLVLAEDHDYARRAARGGKFRVLRSVTARTSMRRVKKEGQANFLRILWYSEVRTLAGVPIRRLPKNYHWGSAEGDPGAS